MATRQHESKGRAARQARDHVRQRVARARVSDEQLQNPHSPADLHLDGFPQPESYGDWMEDAAHVAALEQEISDPRILRASRRLLRTAQRFLFGAVDASDREELNRRFVASYQQMLLAILYPTTLYFAVMAGLYYFDGGIKALVYLGSMSAAIAIACQATARDLSRRPLTMGELELRGLALFAMIFAHLVIHHLFHPELVKLILFLFLALVTATASVSIRIAVASIAICMATMLWFAYEAGEAIAVEYAFVGFAGGLVAFCMALLTRIAITKEIHAGLTADRLLNKAEYNANHDMLTELPNRRDFFRQLEMRMKEYSGAVPAFALAVIDLDGFKSVNDTYGHSVGDKLLVALGARLTKACSMKHVVARLGGDEFAMIIDNPKDAGTMFEFGQCIRKEIEKPFKIMGISISISASIGIALEQFNILTGNEMIERADFAVYRAKKEKHGVVVFSPELEEERRNKLTVEHNLRHCNRAEEMYVVFHPQTDIRAGRTVGFEALARWKNPELGYVRPDVFITAAERIGVISELTPLFLEKALAAARDWPEQLRLSFNLSISDIDSPDAIDNILHLVRESGFAPERVEFEITETLIMTDFEQAQRSIRKLQALGARVALDDFGTGYANFAYIGQLNIETIKIDRSFVSRLAEGDITIKVVKTMIDMCANLGVACLVEGVETEHQLNLLRRIGATYVQGHYYSEPMPAGDVAPFLMRELQKDVSAAPFSVSSDGTASSAI